MNKKIIKIKMLMFDLAYKRMTSPLDFVNVLFERFYTNVITILASHIDKTSVIYSYYEILTLIFIQRVSIQ